MVDHSKDQLLQLSAALASATASAQSSVVAIRLNFDEPVDWTRFGIWLTMLLHRHGDALLRVKGILNVADAATPVAVHAVHYLVHPPRHLGGRPDESGGRDWFSSPAGSIRR